MKRFYRYRVIAANRSKVEQCRWLMNGVKISDDPQSMSLRTLRGAFLLPPSLLVVADLEVMPMGTVTAKQLKQKTGDVIKRIQSGERLILTYRGKPLAVIEPATDKNINKLNSTSDSVKAWERIESALNRTNPEFKNWREATRWIRNRN